MKTINLLFLLLIPIATFAEPPVKMQEVYIEKYGITLQIPAGWIEIPSDLIDWYNNETDNNIFVGLNSSLNTNPLNGPHILVGFNEADDIEELHTRGELFSTLCARMQSVLSDNKRRIEPSNGYLALTDISTDVITISFNNKLIVWKMHLNSGGVPQVVFMAFRPIKSGYIRFTSVFLDEPNEQELKALEMVFNSITINENLDISDY